MAEAEDFLKGFDSTTPNGSLVDRPDNGNGIAGIRIDLDGKIRRYLDNLHISSWPMHIYYINRTEEREAAEDWIKHLIAAVLNS